MKSCSKTFRLTGIQRIKQWYNNHSRGGASRTGQRRKILDLGKAKKQMPQWQIYSALYYKAKLKDLIHAKWETYYRKENPDYDPTKDVPKITLSFVNERVREYFEAETAEVKEEVRQKAEVEQQDVLQDGENGELDPEELKRLKLLNYQRLGHHVNFAVLIRSLTNFIQCTRLTADDCHRHARAS